MASISYRTLQFPAKPPAVPIDEPATAMSEQLDRSGGQCPREDPLTRSTWAGEPTGRVETLRFRSPDPMVVPKHPVVDSGADSPAPDMLIPASDLVEATLLAAGSWIGSPPQYT